MLSFSYAAILKVCFKYSVQRNCRLTESTDLSSKKERYVLYTINLSNEIHYRYIYKS